ncbi:hypothetical protein VFA_004078 [Vibrio furnissii CIP 102972]|nr:hypothetical protein VFA_004078 [Vibrio furnissii CIP 102972]
MPALPNWCNANGVCTFSVRSWPRRISQNVMFWLLMRSWLIGQLFA